MTDKTKIHIRCSSNAYTNDDSLIHCIIRLIFKNEKAGIEGHRGTPSHRRRCVVGSFTLLMQLVIILNNAQQHNSFRCRTAQRPEARAIEVTRDMGEMKISYHDERVNCFCTNDRCLFSGG